MKSIYSHLTKGLLSLAVASATFSACSEDKMDAINRDNDHATSVPAKFTLADVITSTAFYNVGGDFNTYFSTYVEHEVGIFNQLYRAETRTGEPSSSSTFNNTWGNLYSTLKNARIVAERCGEGGAEAGNHTTKGMAEVLEALNAGLITDAFGDAPYSQAAQPTLVNGQPAYMNPVLDSQESIYESILQLLDDAIADLPQGDASAPGNYDLLYKGDASKWLKLAYGLKARYLMHRIHRSTDVTADMNTVLECISHSFASADDQAAFAIYDATNLNPLFDFQWSRDYLAASQSLWTKLTERNDPRARRVLVNPDWTQVNPADESEEASQPNPAPNGTPTPMQYAYDTSIFVYAQTAPTLLMSYHELMFLKAEALCRLNRTADAEVALREAFLAAVSNLENSVTAALNAPNVVSYGGITETTATITQAEAETYFDVTVKPLFEATPLQEVMIQKYIAFWGASGESTECYNDIRRMKAMGTEYVTLENPKNSNRFPFRCPYGNDDVTANPNVAAAQGDGTFVYSEPVWWAGGSR